jgi:dolichyl-phosphate-mannose--protein O-mannosyl transferase
VRTGLADMGEAMRNPSVRYFVVEHVAMMLVAIAFAHIGAARIRKATSDSARFQTATIWMGLALAIAAGFVPWFRPLLPQF